MNEQRVSLSINSNQTAKISLIPNTNQTSTEFTQGIILKGDKGEDGYTPIKGVDYFDGTNGLDGKDGVDGITQDISNLATKDELGTQVSAINHDIFFINTYLDNKAEKTELQKVKNLAVAMAVVL